MIPWTIMDKDECSCRPLQTTQAEPVNYDTSLLSGWRTAVKHKACSPSMTHPDPSRFINSSWNGNCRPRSFWISSIHFGFPVSARYVSKHPGLCSRRYLLPHRYCQDRARIAGGIPFRHRSFTYIQHIGLLRWEITFIIWNESNSWDSPGWFTRFL